MNQNVAACIVTYNRKDLLVRCLTAILQQVHLPDSIIIVDNLSTDSTFEEITTRTFPSLELQGESEYGFIYEGEKVVESHSISVIYIQKKKMMAVPVAFT